MLHCCCFCTGLCFLLRSPPHLRESEPAYRRVLRCYSACESYALLVVPCRALNIPAGTSCLFLIVLPFVERLAFHRTSFAFRRSRTSFAFRRTNVSCLFVPKPCLSLAVLPFVVRLAFRRTSRLSSIAFYLSSNVFCLSLKVLPFAVRLALVERLFPSVERLLPFVDCLVPFVERFAFRRMSCFPQNVLPFFFQTYVAFRQTVWPFVGRL